jgi:hypothetical protein
MHDDTCPDERVDEFRRRRKIRLVRTQNEPSRVALGRIAKERAELCDSRTVTTSSTAASGLRLNPLSRS